MGTPAADIAPAIAREVAGQVIDIAAELELGAAISITAAVVATDDAVDVAGGGAALPEVRIEGKRPRSTADATAVPVETAEEAAPLIDAVANAVAAKPAGLAAIGLHIDITHADGRVVSSRVLVVWEGEDCTAIRQAQHQISTGLEAAADSFPKRYMLTQLRRGMPCCVSIVYFGINSRVALEQRDAAEVARNFRRDEAARGALWTGMAAEIEELKCKIAASELADAVRNAAAAQLPEGSAGHMYPTAAPTARSVGAAVRAYPTYPHVSALDEPFPHAAAHHP